MEKIMAERFWGVNNAPEVEIRKAADGSTVLVGYAAIFNSLSEDLGGFREIIREGAFDQALAERPDVAARVQHMGGLSTIGRTTNGTLKLSVDDKGLRYEVTPPNTSAGRDIVELVSKRYINKSSFAFSLREDGDKPAENWFFESDPPTRELLNVNLYDVAPVDGPAYEATSINVRALEVARQKAPPPAPKKSDAELRAERLKENRERIAAFRVK
jgi:HK97 family phage prohead protease